MLCTLVPTSFSSFKDGLDGVIGLDITEGVAGYSTDGDAIDGDSANLVAGCRCNGICLASAVVHRGSPSRSDAAVRSG